MNEPVVGTLKKFLHQSVIILPGGKGFRVSNDDISHGEEGFELSAGAKIEEVFSAKESSSGAPVRVPREVADKVNASS